MSDDQPDDLGVSQTTGLVRDILWERHGKVIQFVFAEPIEYEA